MTRYEQIKCFDVDEMAWFIQTVIDEIEEGVLEKLSMYGLEVSMISLASEVRHAKIVADLLKEVDDEHT